MIGRATDYIDLDTKKIGPVLQGRLGAALEADTFDVYISVAGNPASEYLHAESSGSCQQEISATVHTLKTRCAELQHAVLQYLNRSGLHADSQGCRKAISQQIQTRNTETFWVNNIIKAELSVNALLGVLKRDDIDHVELVQQMDRRNHLSYAPDVIATPLMGGPDTARSPAHKKSTITAWGVQRVGAHYMWPRRLTGNGVVVAILDSGVNYQHPDLAQQMWAGGEAYPLYGYNFEGEDNDPMDEMGHGTCCAGIVAGNGKSGLVTGVAPDATVMAVRIDNKESTCWKGMQFALENGAHVINQSLSWMHTQGPYERGWRRACETLLALGVLHATSAGNKGDWQGPFAVPHNIGTPANCPPPWLHPAQSARGGISSAVACGSTDERDFLDDDSATGPVVWDEGPYCDYPCVAAAPVGLIKPDVCAPGCTDTCNWKYPAVREAGAYTTFGSTSSATAHVAGSMALLAQACQRSDQPVSPARIQEALESSAVRIRGRHSAPARQQRGKKENGFGAGRIDVHAAYQFGMRKGWWL